MPMADRAILYTTVITNAHMVFALAVLRAHGLLQPGCDVLLT